MSASAEAPTAEVAALSVEHGTDAAALKAAQPKKEKAPKEKKVKVPQGPGGERPRVL